MLKNSIAIRCVDTAENEPPKDPYLPMITNRSLGILVHILPVDKEKKTISKIHGEIRVFYAKVSPLPGCSEIPSCPVCIEHLDISVTGILTEALTGGWLDVINSLLLDGGKAR